MKTQQLGFLRTVLYSTCSFQSSVVEREFVVQSSPTKLIGTMMTRRLEGKINEWKNYGKRGSGLC